MGDALTSFDVYEASIADILTALAAGAVTSEALVQQYLARIDAFDRGPEGLNSVSVRNPDALAAARAADARWRDGTARALEGVPFTVKDSYMVQGLTVAAGSPAFAQLIAQRDAFTVAQLRAAGAVLIGKTNMPPMADGGMQRGVYGRSESPYNRDSLPAAFASGSSHGSAVSTTASFAAFGMGEETVSSGRSPASNNALCAYTPSWGVLSIRGNWPLFPARDVVVPHTRTMADMLTLLDVLVCDDPETRGDFWRHQTVVPIPLPSEHRPVSYAALGGTNDLRGKRFAIPSIYVNPETPYPSRIRDSVRELFAAACERLRELGATLVETDFPLIERYEGDRPGQENVAALGVLPEGWMDTEFRHFLAFGWEDFLRANGDPGCNTLAGVDPDQIFPQPPGALPDRYEEIDDYENRYRETVAFAKAGIPDPRDRPDFAEGVRALQQLRRELVDDWLAAHGCDAVVFPANGDVAPADADVNPASADIAWENGVFFSNGNYALRHLGVPSVTVAMGVMRDTQMPVGVTFAGAGYADVALLEYASVFERAGSGSLRIPPASTPSLQSRTPARS